LDAPDRSVLTETQEETLKEWTFLERLKDESLRDHFVTVAKGVFQGLRRADIATPSQKMVSDVLSTVLVVDPLMVRILGERPRFHIPPMRAMVFVHMFSAYLVCYNWSDIAG